MYAYVIYEMKRRVFEEFELTAGMISTPKRRIYRACAETNQKPNYLKRFVKRFINNYALTQHIIQHNIL